MADSVASAAADTPQTAPESHREQVPQHDGRTTWSGASTLGVAVPKVEGWVTARSGWLPSLLAGLGAALAAYVLAMVVYQVALHGMEAALASRFTGGVERMTSSLIFSALNNLTPQSARLVLATWLLAPIQGDLNGKFAASLAEAAGGVHAQMALPSVCGLLLATLPALVAGNILTKRAHAQPAPASPSCMEALLFAAAYAATASMVVVSGSVDTGEIPLANFGGVNASLSVSLFPLVWNAFLVGLVGFTGGSALANRGREPERPSTGGMLANIPPGVRVGLQAFGVNLCVVYGLLLLLTVGGALSNMGKGEMERTTVVPVLLLSPLTALNWTPLAFLGLSGGVVSARMTSSMANANSLWGLTWNSVQGVRLDGAAGSLPYGGNTVSHMLEQSGLVLLALGILLAPALIHAGFRLTRECPDARWRQGLSATGVFLGGCFLLSYVGQTYGSATVTGGVGKLVGSAHLGDFFAGADFFASLLGLWLPAAAWITCGLLLRRAAAPGFQEPDDQPQPA